MFIYWQFSVWENYLETIMIRIKFIEDKVAVLTENYFWNRRNIYEEVFEINDFRIGNI